MAITSTTVLPATFIIRTAIIVTTTDAGLSRDASAGRHRRFSYRRARPAEELDRQPDNDRRGTSGRVFAGLGAGRTPLAALEASEVTVPVCVSAVGELRI